jgi:hypothetical protein
VPCAAAQSFSPPVRAGREDVAAAHGVPPAGGDHRRPRREILPVRRPEVVDLVLLRQHPGAQHRAAGEGQGVVGEEGDHAAVDVPVLLEQFLTYRHLEHRLPLRERGEPCPHQR